MSSAIVNSDNYCCTINANFSCIQLKTIDNKNLPLPDRILDTCL